MVRFVEVNDPKDKPTECRTVRIGNCIDCDYTYDQWKSMMEYYYAYEYRSSKSD